MSTRVALYDEGMTARVYQWSNRRKVALINLDMNLAGLQLKVAIPFKSGHKQHILLQTVKLRDESTGSLYLFDASAFDSRAQNETDIKMKATTAVNELVVSKSSALAAKAAHILGVITSHHSCKPIFLDSHSWVCSVDMRSWEDYPLSYSRHFFIPYDWFAGMRDIIRTIADQDIVFARNDELAVIKWGFECEEVVTLGMEAD
ncbi:hypothetical protein FQN49_000434 [Arthroderma sp. PD_2]|nr:hypothetical protein FQN49_000434 [Arthroderma sp. PD_2]